MFGTILVAVDGSPCAELGRRLAGDSGDKVVVLHVTEIMPMRGGSAWSWNLTARAWKPPAALPRAWQSMVFTTLALLQLGHALAVRSERESLFSLGA
jgi:hypothetical protein